MELENTLVIPDNARRYVRLRRDRELLRTFEVDHGKVERGRADLATYRAEIVATLDHELTAPALAEAGHAYLAGERNPLGAGAVMAARNVWRADGHDWIEQHGPVFAAEALLAYSRLVASNMVAGQYESRHYLRERVLPGDNLEWTWRAVGAAEAVRDALACADDAEYAAAVALLAQHRHDELGRLLAAFLVPNETAWVDDLIAHRDQHGPARALSELTIGVPGTPQQWRALGVSLWALETHVYTLVHTLGPDAAPLLATTLDGDAAGGDTRKLLVAALALLPTDEAFGMLLSRAGQKHVQGGLIAAMRRFPHRAVRMLAVAAGRDKTAQRLLFGLLQADPDLLNESWSDSVRAGLDGVLAAMERVPEAENDKLPPLLVSPPWTVKRAKGKSTPPAGIEAPTGTVVSWLPGEREQWAEIRAGYGSTPEERRGYLFKQMPVLPGGEPDWQHAADLMRDRRAKPEVSAGLLLLGPADLARPLLDGRCKLPWQEALYLEHILARFEADAVPMTLTWVQQSMPAYGHLLLPFVNADIAWVMANAYSKLRSMRDLAAGWFARHGTAVVPYLLPAVFYRTAAERKIAEAALRLMATQTSPDAVLAEVERFGPEARAAVEALVGTDPFQQLPAKMPAIGDWADVDLLPQIRLRGGDGLPREATRHLLTMLAISRVDEPYAGVAVVRELCDPKSLAEFAWALFAEWRAGGEVTKDNWALTAVGLLGDDDCVRRLAPIIRAWPGEGGHAKAVSGLDVLAAIGTDVALTHLSSIAQKVKFKALKQRAQEKIAAVAEGIGLTADQLADRLVPTFGLDDAATLRVDYGSRSFTVGFDEQLKPYVIDGDGKRRKDLPKPAGKDDAELAPAEHARFAALRKDVRTVAADQILRLENAMVHQRDWSAEEFTTLLAGHPLLWHIVRRLVWIDDAGTGFRLAEDRTPADVDDNTFELRTDARVRLAHPLTLGDAVTAWSEVLADYEILQPFPQLGRPVFTLTDEERAATWLHRFEGVKVPVGKLLGLTKRSWQRTPPQDNGCEWTIVRPSPGVTAVLPLDPGITVGMIDMDPEQVLGAIKLDVEGGDGWWNHQAPLRPFGELDPITASELLAELTALTS
ncbi:DUF4132 domain-containing protein [Kutzneria sp. NPDC051319]|uniref:DUF4132 domain-containing protein n=1 Tax=Kutzneria sp. NPDC051319 TaxID=3155047 RepID=UPI00342A06FA